MGRQLAGSSLGMIVNGSHLETDNYRDNNRLRQQNAQADLRWRGENATLYAKFGADDQRGRMNLVTREKVLQGVAEVKEGISFCLSLPLDFPGGTALNQRRHPPVVAPTEDMDGNAATFYNVHMSEMKDFGDPKYVDVAVLRWQAQSGEQAKLEGDDRSFEEVAQERVAHDRVGAV